MHDTAVYNRLPDGISGRLCGCDRRGRRIDFTSGEMCIRDRIWKVEHPGEEMPVESADGEK